MFKLLFFGDIVGAIGRQAVVKILPKLREEFAPDFVVANVENLAHGRGITAKTLLELDAAGIDAYTSGNHVFENPVGLSCFDDARWKDRIVRPANMDPKLPGHGSIEINLPLTKGELRGSVRLAIFNILGQLFVKENPSSPFLAFDRLFSEASDADVVLVDFHAEATSEKEAFGHFADGRATAVFGTHTHVPTADEKILPGGTAYTTDVGRNGEFDSVVGFEKNSALKVFLDSNAKSYEISTTGTAEINAVLLTVDLDTKKAVALDRIRRFVDV